VVGGLSRPLYICCILLFAIAVRIEGRLFPHRLASAAQADVSLFIFVRSGILEAMLASLQY
jgi:hypothetical protein